MTSTLNNTRRAARGAALALLLVAASAIAARAQQSTPAPQETPPPPAAPRSVTVPKPVERTLSNGLRVIVIEDHDMPLVSAQLIVKSGGEVDPAALSGVADMTASLLTKGTKTRTAPQIASEIESLGGTLTSAAGWDASRATLNVMSSKIEPAMAVLSDVVRNPVFDAEEIERLRQQYADGLSVAMQDPGQLAGYVASRVVFGDAAYGHPVSGTPESIPAIKREDIVKVHSTYYRPDNSLLVIGGDIAAADAFKLAERLFGDWAKPAAALPAAGAAKANADAKPRVVVVDMPEAGQAAVVLARRGLSRTDPEYFRGIVSNAVLSGYSGRLNQEIRIKRGLSYGARSSLEARRDTGPFIASAQTKNPSGAEVAGLLVGEIGRLANEPIVGDRAEPAQVRPHRRLRSLSGDDRRAGRADRLARALRAEPRRDQQLHRQRAGRHARRDSEVRLLPPRREGREHHHRRQRERLRRGAAQTVPRRGGHPVRRTRPQQRDPA